MKSRPLSILFFSNSTVRAGVEEHILELLRRLDRRRFRIHLACPAELMEKYANDIPKDVQVTTLMLDNLWDLRGALRLARTIRNQKIDILHSHLFRASMFASPIGWLCRIPVIVETPHLREAWRKGWLKGNFFIDRLLGRFVSRYIAVSEANARYLAEEKRLQAHKIEVIHNGSDLDRFDPRRQAPVGFKQALGFAEDDPLIVVVARLEPQKGHAVMLDAHAQIVRCAPRARLVCVGEGSLRQELEAQAESLGIGKSVRFVGFQPNVADWLAIADINVLPSFYEGLPLVAIEALAAGRPTVATAVDGTTEVIVNQQTGLTVPPGQATALASAVLQLLSSPELSDRLARAGRQWVEEHFGIEQQIRRTEALYLKEWNPDFRCDEEISPLDTVGLRESKGQSLLSHDGRAIAERR